MLEPYAYCWGSEESRSGSRPSSPSSSSSSNAEAGHVHGTGDRGLRIALDGFEAARLARERPDRCAPRTADTECLHADDVPRFAELGVAPIMQPRHCAPEIVADWRANVGPVVMARCLGVPIASRCLARLLERLERRGDGSDGRHLHGAHTGEPRRVGSMGPGGDRRSRDRDPRLHDGWRPRRVRRGPSRVDQRREASGPRRAERRPVPQSPRQTLAASSTFGPSARLSTAPSCTGPEPQVPGDPRRRPRSDAEETACSPSARSPRASCGADVEVGASAQPSVAARLRRPHAASTRPPRGGGDAARQSIGGRRSSMDTRIGMRAPDDRAPTPS